MPNGRVCGVSPPSRNGVDPFAGVKNPMNSSVLPQRRDRSSLLAHLVVVGGCASTLVAFHFSDDERTGRGSVSDAAPLAPVFLLLGYYVGWLPDLWDISKRRWFGSLSLPIFVALVVVYFSLAFRTDFIQPGAARWSVLVQWLALIDLSARV